jgi:p-cumate 2,3-dioxygenase alpha subunit
MKPIAIDDGAEGPLAGIKAGPVVSRACYTDPKIFELEQERLFERAWLFVAHESEFVQPGDFRTTDIAGQPVLAVMGADRKIRVLFNSCRHRGAIVEMAREGNRGSFRCLYHHWEYGADGALQFVPRSEGYGPEFNQDDFGLVPLPRVESFEGLIFASLDPDAPDLKDYIGAITPSLTYVATYGDRKLQSLGYYEYTYNANWKLICENTMDDYHAQYLHGVAFAQRSKIVFNLEGVGGSHVKGTKALLYEKTRECFDFGMHGTIHWEEVPETLRLQQKRTRHAHVAVFPTFLMLYHPVWDVTGIRIVKPLSVDRTKIMTHCLGPADAPEEVKRQIAENFHSSWGPGGRVGVDDIVAFEQVQKGLKAKTAGDVIITRGLERAQGGPADEHALRSFWNGWRHFVLGEGQQTPAAVPLETSGAQRRAHNAQTGR